MASFDAIVNFTLDKEAGLSRDPGDNAAKYPSPYTFQGFKDWHTNKGITYKTFEAAAKDLGIDNNYTNFIVMPRSIWYKIAKKLFWDKLNLSDLKNQSIANLMFSWFWGSGYSWRNRMVNFLKSYNITWDKNDFKALVRNLNYLSDKYSPKTFYKELDKQYRLYLISLKSKYENAWLKRLDELFELNYNDLLKFASNNKGKLITASILFTAAYIIKNAKV